MLVTWKYRPRDTFIQKLDPRTRLIFMISMVIAITIPDIWDYRLIFFALAFSLTLFFMARIEWRDVRRVLLFMFILVFVIVGINGVFFGRGGPSSVLDPNSPVIFQIPFMVPGTDWGVMLPVTVAKAWFAIVQIARMFAMALPAIAIPYTMDPNIYGTAFKQLGASDKVSFTMDLAFRFLPTFARDLTLTMDAQRARGYELETLKGGLFEKIRKLAPMVIPVTMQSTVTGEEVIDAMDLRAFGTAPRTWIKHLQYSFRDYFMISVFIILIISFCILRWGFGIGEFFVPGFFTNLFVG